MIFRAVVMVIAGLALPVTAQDAPRPPQDLATSTEVVLVDVVVVDGDGQPVTDLQRGEFVLREEGREQPITHFERLRLEEQSVVAVPRPPVSTNMAPASATPVAVLAIVFDERHLRPETVPAARKAVERLLDRGLRAGEEMLLLATGSGDLWTARDETGLLAFRSRLPGLRGLRVRSVDEDLINEPEAMRIAVYDERQTLERVRLRILDKERAFGGLMSSRSSSTRRVRIDSTEHIARNLARRVWDEAGARAQATLASLEGLARLLGARRGRKSAVLVTEGFVVDARAKEWQQTLETARRSNLVIYGLDARGLRTDTAGVTAETGRKAMVLGGDELALTDREASEGSDALVTETGGFTRRNTNDLDGALARIAAESRNYYLLGFQPGTPPDGKYRKLSVDVLRPGLTVRARKGYYALRPTEMAAPKSAPIPLRVAAFVREPRGEGATHVQLVGEIDPGAIQFKKDGEHWTAAIDWVAEVFTPSKGAAPSQPQRLRLNLTPEALASVGSTWVPVGAEFDLPAGPHLARFFVRDEGGGRTGTVEHLFEVPPPRSLYVSTVLSDLARGQGTRAPAFIARRSFPTGTRLLYQFEVHNARQVLAGHEVRTSAGVVLTRSEEAPVSSGSDGRLARLILISLEKTPPGRYEVVLHVRDEVAGSVELIEPFEVTASASSPATD